MYVLMAVRNLGQAILTLASPLLWPDLVMPEPVNSLPPRLVIGRSSERSPSGLYRFALSLRLSAADGRRFTMWNLRTMVVHRATPSDELQILLATVPAVIAGRGAH